MGGDPPYLSSNAELDFDVSNHNYEPFEPQPSHESKRCHNSLDTRIVLGKEGRKLGRKEG